MYVAFRVLVLFVVLLPLASALLVWPLRQRAARRVALWLAVLNLAFGCALIACLWSGAIA